MRKRKKKRWLLLLIVLVLLLAMIGCGGSGDKEEPATADTSTAEVEETADTPEETADDTTDTENSDSSLISPEFKKTMDDYEAWFDHYCEVMKKYQENPSDMEILTEMTSLLSEEVEMLDQLENMDESEMTNAELAYYLEVTARIEKKLLEVADY